tara:strand:- start:122 stop:733 length:612 start_codon:yes stop_codon:yes gene_type:complete
MTEKKKTKSQEAKMAVAELAVTSPETYSAFAMRDHLGVAMKGMSGELDVLMLQQQLFDATERILKGDDTHIQAVLINQMETMNTLFYEMISRMTTAKYIPQLKAYGNLALQFQNQTRRTAATLAELQNPKKTTFVRQANIATNQQINQVVAPENSENNSQLENQVLEERHVERLDDRTQEAAVGVNPQMETLGTLNGAKVPRG